MNIIVKNCYWDTKYLENSNFWFSVESGYKAKNTWRVSSQWGQLLYPIFHENGRSNKRSKKT